MNLHGKIIFLFCCSLSVAHQASAYERSCSGRIFAELHDHKYQIDLHNHVSVRGEGATRSLARWEAMLNLHYCAMVLYQNRATVQQNPSKYLSEHCPEATNMSPLAADMQTRLEKLACSATWRSLVNSGDFTVDLRMESRGEEGCGGDKEKEIAYTLIKNIKVSASHCT